MKIRDRMCRVDSVEKINGKVRYIEDIDFENLHFARTLRSTIAKGEILGIDYPNIPDGIWVVDASDTPVNEVLMIKGDMPVFAETTVNYIGEPIALIVGKDKQQVIEFMNGIVVNYREDVAIFHMDECRGHEDRTYSSYQYQKGDIDELDYDDTFEKVYSTGYQEQLYMEKQGLVGEYSDNIVTIYGSMQCPYYIKNALIHSTELSGDNIRVIQNTTGGAFGGKEEYPSLMACQLAVATMKVKAPVELIFDRREDILYTTKRHPSQTKIKTYLKDRKIVGMEFLYELDGGPYWGLTDVVLQRGILTLTGCYNIENVKVEGKAYKTNNIFTGAFRGFGAPQSMFALEQHMNQLARYLNKDPIEFRRQYFVKKGDISATSGVFNETIMLQEMADKLEKMSDYEEIKNKKDNFHGVGVAFIPHGGGFTGDGEASHIKAVVNLKKDENDYIHILVSSVEMGQGAKTVLSKIVASVLDLSIDRIIYDDPDTFKVPDSGPTVASRTTMVVGGLLYKAARKLKSLMSQKGEVLITETFKQPDNIKWDQKQLKGNAYLSYSWAAVIAEVEVDPVTFEIMCTNIHGIYDVGLPIDEDTFIGQVHGGVAQGLGYGMLEVMESIDGLIQQNSFSSYSVPTMADMPRMYTDWIYNPYKEGPYGAKAAGELTLVGVAPAIASAVQDAIGIEINDLPVTSEKILAEVLR